MNEKNQLQQQLKEMGIKRTDTVMLHSSLKNINRDGDLVLDVLMDYFKDGLLLLPTHTWRQMNENYNVFDPETEDSCVGLLTNMFRKRPHVVRSLHPTHSIAGYGKKAKAFLSGEEKATTPCPVNGAWDRLNDPHTNILLIGCGLNRNTYVHAIEERLDVPNRLAEKPISLTIKKGDERIVTPFHTHYNEKHPDISQHYAKIEDQLVKENILTYHQFGDARALLMNAKALNDFVEGLLKEDIEYFSEP